MAEADAGGSRASGRLIDGARLSGFIYGTTSGLVALGGVGVREPDFTAWWEAATRVILGAAAVWMAHAYAELLSHRVVSGRPLEFRELRATLASSWSILVAGLVLAAPLVPAGLGVVSVGMATNVSRALGVTVLALIGFYAEQTGEHRWGRRLLHAGLTAGLGLAVVAVELLVYH